MVDDAELRRLERELAATGAPEARVRLARELERVGRRDDAFFVLKPGIADAAVRAEIARWPAWTHASGDAGRRACIDVAPVRSTPRVAVFRRDSIEIGALTLLASPLALVLTETRETNDGDVSTLRVLDPEAGAPRFDREARWLVFHTSIHGEHLTITEGVHDLRSGELVMSWPYGGSAIAGASNDGDILLLRHSGELRCVRLRGKEFEIVWRASLPGTPPRTVHVVAWSDAHVLLCGRRALTSLDRRTGAILWEKPVDADWNEACADARLVLAQLGHHATSPLEAFDSKGASLWRTRVAARARVLGDGYVVAEVLSSSERGLITLDARTGESIHILRARASWEEGLAVAAAREVVYFTRGPRSVSAETYRGEWLWDLDLPDSAGTAPIAALAPAPRQLYVALADGTIISLEP